MSDDDKKPMSFYIWPRTAKGWKALFWLWLGRCPIHHTPLNVDRFPYDDGKTAFCFRCEGIGMWPQSAREALRQNTAAMQARMSAGQVPDEHE